MGSLSSMRLLKASTAQPRKSGTNGSIGNLAGTFHGVAPLDEMFITENGDTDVVRLQVETHAANTRREFHHLFGC